MHTFKREEEFRHRRGTILLFCLGVLALLSLLGAALMAISREGETESLRFLDKTRAQFAAESGVDLALSQIMSLTVQPAQITQKIAAMPEDPTCPVEFLTQSSFGSLDSNGNGFNDLAGSISDTYAKDGDCIKLRVQSVQSRININDSNSPFNVDTDPFEDQLEPSRIYSNLPEHLRHPTNMDPDWIYSSDLNFQYAKSPDGKPYPKAEGRLERLTRNLLNILFPAAPARGDAIAAKIFQARETLPTRRFESMGDIRDAIGNLLSDTEFKLFESFLTLDSWGDPNVLRPSFQWRINTPPRQTPGDPLSAHVQFWYGPMLPYWMGKYFRQPPARPGGVNASVDGEDLTSAISFDFDNDGNITPFDPATPYAYHEEVRHDKDIYLYSDMQTKTFALEKRSPIDINNAAMELIEALILPVQGWYLKEEPSVWDGEAPRSRASDWDQPTRDLDISFKYKCHPFLRCVRTVPATHDDDMMTNSLIVDSYLEDNQPDNSQYYYYDSYIRNFVDVKNHSLPNWDSFFLNKNGRYGELNQSKSFSSTLSDGSGKTVAQVLASTLHARIHPDLDGDGKIDAYRPFSTWEEFEYFLLDLCDGDGINDLGPQKDFDIYMAHALIANFNPNSRVNDYNPNKLVYLHVDKSQLIGFSSELCFHPMGYFEITSLGLVRDEKAKARAKNQVTTLAKTQEVFRITSQAQFMEGYDPVGGKKAQDFFSPSNGVSPTAGAAGAYPGHSIQSYPEPELLAQNYISDSIYDGSLMLAVNKPLNDDLFQDNGASNTLYADFNGNLNLSVAGGQPNLLTDNLTQTWFRRHNYWKRYMWWRGMDMLFEYWKESNYQVPGNNPGARPLCRSLSQAHDAFDIRALPGNLYPDGAFSEAGRSLKYDIVDNLGENSKSGRVGSMEFWIKPNFSAAHSNRIRKFFSAPPPPKTPYPTVDKYEDPYFGGPAICDYTKVFDLFYIPRGGKRAMTDASGLLSDNTNINYSADYNMNNGLWLPTRSLFLCAEQCEGHNGWTPFNQFAYSGYTPGIGTDSVNQSWRQNTDTPTPGIDRYNLEGWQWNHLAFSWDWVGTFVGGGLGTNGSDYIKPARYFEMAVNGKFIESVRESQPDAMHSGTAFGAPTKIAQGLGFPMRFPLYYDSNGNSNYVSFGAPSTALWNNISADSTYDIIAGSKLCHHDPTLVFEYGFGRYYEGNDAHYDSPVFNLFEETQTPSQSLTLAFICWTAYWPKTANPGMPSDHPRFNDNRVGANSDFYANFPGKIKTDGIYPSDPMAAIWGGNYAPFSIDLYDNLANNWHYEINGFTPIEMPNHAGGSFDPAWSTKALIWDRNKPDFRFRVHFHVDDNQSLYASPVFDDITFCFLVSRPQLLRWEIEE